MGIGRQGMSRGIKCGNETLEEFNLQEKRDENQRSPSSQQEGITSLQTIAVAS
jgi:hypothetical protein